VPVEDETSHFCPATKVIEREHVRIGLPFSDDQPAGWLQHPA
jgi:hypothetical protein